MQVFRLDTGSLKKAIKTDRGYLKAEGFATRMGIFLYQRADGSMRKELRPEAEVFHPDSLSSLASIPITNDHPAGMVNAENAKHHSVGFTGEKVEKHDAFVKVSLNVTHKDCH